MSWHQMQCVPVGVHRVVSKLVWLVMLHTCTALCNTAPPALSLSHVAARVCVLCTAWSQVEAGETVPGQDEGTTLPIAPAGEGCVGGCSPQPPSFHGKSHSATRGAQSPCIPCAVHRTDSSHRNVLVPYSHRQVQGVREPRPARVVQRRAHERRGLRACARRVRVPVGAGAARRHARAAAAVERVQRGRDRCGRVDAAAALCGAHAHAHGQVHVTCTCTCCARGHVGTWACAGACTLSCARHVHGMLSTHRWRPSST